MINIELGHLSKAKKTISFLYGASTRATLYVKEIRILVNLKPKCSFMPPIENGPKGRHVTHCLHKMDRSDMLFN